MYESIALGKPCLYQANTEWEDICSVYPAGKAIDFRDLTQSQSHLNDFLKAKYFYLKPGDEVLWKSDEAKFLEVVGRLTENV